MAVALAASLMGMPLPLEDPPRGATAPLQIEARADATRSARARATAVRAAAARRTPARVAPLAADDVAPPSVDRSQRVAFEPAPTPRHITPPPPPARAATPPPPAPRPASATGPAAAPPPAAARPLQPLGTGVNDATDVVAVTLRTLTKDLGDGVQPLSPALAAVATRTGDTLGDIVEGTGNVLGQALGRPARPRRTGRV